MLSVRPLQLQLLLYNTIVLTVITLAHNYQPGSGTDQDQCGI